MSAEDIDSVLERVRRSDKQKVKVAITDIDGVLRGKYLHKDKFLGAAESGFGFCNVVFGWDSSDVCYDNGTYTGWHTGYPDALARVDLSTHRHVPWDGQVPFFLADFEDGAGKALPVCPRRLLKQVIAHAEDAGYRPSAGMEFEWFNFRETPQTFAEKHSSHPQPLTPGMFGYSVLRMAQNQPFFNAIMDELLAFGVPIEGLHTETGPGVYEAAILYSGALECADRAVLFKSGVRELGTRFGIMPSFMAKWNSQLPGCSGHTHLSLWKGDVNLFHDAKDPQRMSALCKSYIAGVLHCLPEILPFFAPTVNSYKRLVDGYWAPTKVTWGIDNRTVAVRMIPGNAKSTRIEVRVPGSDVNPYLCVAACVAAGLYGVQKNLTLKHKAVQGSAYVEHVSASGATATASGGGFGPGGAPAERLPRSLQEATRRLSESKVARELFGEAFVDHFVRTREWEWRQFQDSVTSWELQRYFEII